MKHTVKVFTLALSLFLFQHLPMATADSGSIVVSKVEGGPMILRDGQAIPATVGMVCQTNDTFKTTAGCVLDVTMNNKVGARFLPSSEGTLVDAKKNLLHLKIKEGNAIFNSEKLAKNSEFKVETPTAIASVRGTQFWGRVDLQQIENPVTTFAVREGAIEIFIKSLGESFLVPEGKALDISKEETTAPLLRPALEEELKAMAQASSIQTSA